VKEEALKYLEAIFQETKKASFISTVEDSTVMEAWMVNSPSMTLSQETFGEFENLTRGIGYKIMR